MNNFMAERGLGEHVEPYKADNLTQGISMVATGDFFFGGLIAGKPQVGGVAIAEAESTVAITTRTANLSRVKNATEMAGELSAQIGKNSVQYKTPNKVGHIDLQGKGHFDKVSGGVIGTPHVQERVIHQQPGGGKYTR